MVVKGPVSEACNLHNLVSILLGLASLNSISNLTPTEYADALNTLKFTTIDQDNGHHHGNCASVGGRRGGW